MGRGIGTPDALPGDRSGPGSRQGNERASMPPDAQGAVRRAPATAPGSRPEEVVSTRLVVLRPGSGTYLYAYTGA